MKHSTQYIETIRANARQKAETEFNAKCIGARKNVLLMKDGNSYFTVKVNFHTMTFHSAQFGLIAAQAPKFFHKQADKSIFNPDADIPEQPELLK
jgi:hypothetical protein